MEDRPAWVCWGAPWGLTRHIIVCFLRRGLTFPEFKTEALPSLSKGKEGHKGVLRWKFPIPIPIFSVD